MKKISSLLLFSFPLVALCQIFSEPEHLVSYPVVYSEMNDIDQDGDLDFIWVDRVNHLFMGRENDGYGNLGSPVELGYLNLVMNRVYEDMDGDGDIDVFSDGSAGMLSWYENTGFNELVYHELGSYIQDFEMVRLHDFNHDGYIDIAAIHTNNDLIIYENSGSGEFTATATVYSGPESFSQLRLEDIDLDNEVDFLLSNFNDDMGVSWIKNNGDSSFSELEVFTPNFNSVYNFSSFKDLDDDGDTDITFRIAEEMCYLVNDDNSFLTSDTVVLADSLAYITVYHMDLDNDEDNDLVLTTFNQGLWWLENYTDGSFSEKKYIYKEPESTTTSSFIMPWHLSFSDYDLDGNKDLLVSTSFETTSPSGTIAFFKNIQGESCTDSLACNYNPIAVIDDGMCCFSECGCTDELALNYLSSATCHTNLCSYILGDLNSDGEVSTLDLSYFLSAFGTFCQADDFCLADMNGDGVVGITDLSNFLASF